MDPLDEPIDGLPHSTLRHVIREWAFEFAGDPEAAIIDVEQHVLELANPNRS